MSQQNKTPTIKLETEENQGKDKDKMNSNEIKNLFNIMNTNNFDDYIKESRNINKVKLENPINKKTFLKFNDKNTFFKYKSTNFSSEREKEKRKDNSYDDILTIINTSKKNKRNSFMNPKLELLDKIIKRKSKQIDMFYQFKYRNVKPQKDYSLKNSSSTFFSNSETKNHVKKTLPKTEKVNKNIQKKKQIFDPNLEKILSKSNNSVITAYLERKKINDLPILYPLFLSYNNSYENQSQKSRVNRILEKFVILKTQIMNDYKNKDKILKEFLLKNGIHDKKYLTTDKIYNLNEYLKKPFKFDPNKMTSEIIKEALNYKSDKFELDKNQLKPVNIFSNYNILNRNKSLRHFKSKSIGYLKPKETTTYKNPICLKFEELKYDQKNLPKLIKELEENIEKIQNEGNEKINKLRGGYSKLKKFVFKDNNKFVPNLCLLNEDFKEQYDYLINKENRKLLNNYNKSQHIREINDRMYYNNLKKKYQMQGFNDEIKRKLKLTEYIIVQRAKKKFFLEKFNKFN